jgi:transcriptional regulator with GAF, ATPase, and Fis domain
VVVHSPDRAAVGARIVLGQAVVVVGRDVDGPGVRLDDLQLSRVHFRVVYDGRAECQRVGDAGSRNGTFVDGARVESAILRPGAVLRAGETVFVHEHEDPMVRIRDRAARVAPSDLTVLVTGETGTGKERIARAIHEQSGRSGPFVAINCAALPRELLGAELFGHTRGAFSGAKGARLGLFQSADGGTLLLDEIGDLPQDLQPVLLRVLQEGVVRPLGSDAEVQVDVRVVAATHQDLTLAVESELFRGDLYARIAQAVVHLPPLRERRAEVLALARELAEYPPGTELRLTADAAEALVRHDWPFNVRELESLVRAFVATEGEAVLGLPYLAEHHPQLLDGFREGTAAEEETRPTGAPRTAEPRDRAAMEQLLKRHAGNVSAAAAELGKPRALLYRWLRRVGLDPERFR